MTDLEAAARNIVSQLGDLWHVDVDLRQATNDKADSFVAFVIDQYVKGTEK